MIVKVGDLIRVNEKVNDANFPENKLGIVVESVVEGELFRVKFVNEFVTNIFIDHLEIISQK